MAALTREQQRILDQALTERRENGAQQNNLYPSTVHGKDNPNKNYLGSLQAIENDLREACKREIVFADPVITYQDIPFFRKYTINTIQGKFGSHKSRVAELMCALLLKNNRSETDFLGFERYDTDNSLVCLVDTERNLKDELPRALQSIKLRSGHHVTDEIENFRYTSLKRVERQDRLPALRQWVEHLRASTDQHLFVVLDVVTDCVSSFNNDREALQLADFLGNMCEDFDTTFLCVIHENPGQDSKARGHVGTEVTNKSVTTMSIGFMPMKDGEPSEVIRIRFKKFRHGKRPDPIFLSFCQDSNGLVPASPDQVRGVLEDRQDEAPMSEVKDMILELIEEAPMKRKDVIDELIRYFSCSEATVKRRISDLYKEIDAGTEKRIVKRKEGRDVVFDTPDGAQLIDDIPSYDDEKAPWE